MRKSGHSLMIAFFLLISVVISLHFFISSKNESIEKVLKSDAYSYLSSEAKEYIKQVYEETGDIILTEKNQEANTPYLNPKYVKYLSSSQEEKENFDSVPVPYILPYQVLDEDKANNERSFDLRNINGNSFISKIKNQGNLNLCWDFTSLEQIESYLMIKSGTPYNNSSTVFSTRQLDYATSNNGISDFTNDFGLRELTGGGNYLTSSIILSNGLGLVRDNYMPFNELTTKKELASVLNYSNSLYEVNASVLMPTITNNTTSVERQAIVSAIKNYVMNNGGAYVGTEGPGYSCSIRNTDNTYLIRVDGSGSGIDDGCTHNAGHAMQVIGWKDDYSYSYCKSTCKDKNGNSYACHSTDITNCSSSNLVSGTGAWILRNSWGSSYSYVYLAYDSILDDFYVFTDISAMENRKWSNNYHNSALDTFSVNLNVKDTQTFTKKINTPEKIEKVKFFSFGQNGTFQLSIHTATADYSNIKTVTIPYPGIYTIDLSDKNIVINDSSFDVTIESTNSVVFIKNSIFVFTSNVASTPMIQSTINKIEYMKDNNDYSFRLYSNLKNIPSNANIAYDLLRGTESYYEYLTVQYNTVGRNDINTLLKISSNIPKGTYTLRLSYGNAVETIPVIIKTETVPYVVRYYSNDSNNSLIVQSVESNTPFNIYENSFERLGYLFKEWNRKKDGTGISYLENELVEDAYSDIDLYAQWTPISYSVRFHANGAEGEMPDQIFTYDVLANLNKNTFEYSGKIFSTWNTKEDGTGVSYEDKKEIINLSSINEDVIDLYAIWIDKPEIQYEIEDYIVDDINGTLDWVPIGTSLDTYKSKFILSDGYSINIDLGNKTNIYTGSVVKIYYQGNLVKSYINIVRGDVNGDGLINSADLLKIVRHLKNLATLDAVNWTAADCNEDKKINSADLLKIVKFLKGTGTIQKK